VLSFVILGIRRVSFEKDWHIFPTDMECLHCLYEMPPEQSAHWVIRARDPTNFMPWHSHQSLLDRQSEEYKMSVRNQFSALGSTLDL